MILVIFLGHQFNLLGLKLDFALKIHSSFMFI